jgi:hypothetical protein
MGKKSGFGSGINILDHFSESLETVFGSKILAFFDEDPGSFDPGSGMEKFRSRIRDKHLGSATLYLNSYVCNFIQIGLF